MTRLRFELGTGIAASVLVASLLVGCAFIGSLCSIHSTTSGGSSTQTSFEDNPNDSLQSVGEKRTITIEHNFGLIAASSEQTHMFSITNDSSIPWTVRS